MLAVLAVGGLVGVPLAGATSPGRDGRIAYARKDPAGHWQVWVASARLSGAKRLTNGRADSGWPVWSPDGKKIAFDSSRTDPAPGDSKHINDVFVMKADGSKVRKLTGSKGASADAAWSPDGSHIAFDADRGHYPARQGIYVMDASGLSIAVSQPTINGINLVQVSVTGTVPYIFNLLGTNSFQVSRTVTFRDEGRP